MNLDVSKVKIGDELGTDPDEAWAPKKRG